MYAVVTTRTGVQPTNVNEVDVLGPFDSESEATAVALSLTTQGDRAAVKPIMPAWTN